MGCLSSTDQLDAAGRGGGGWGGVYICGSTRQGAEMCDVTTEDVQLQS